MIEIKAEGRAEPIKRIREKRVVLVHEKSGRAVLVSIWAFGPLRDGWYFKVIVY